jgi:hypothetical protein
MPKEGGPRLWTLKAAIPRWTSPRTGHYSACPGAAQDNLLRARPPVRAGGRRLGLVTVGVEAVAAERVDKLALFVGEMRQQGIGQQVRGILEFGNLAR